MIECTACHTIKSLDAFPLDRKRKNGRGKICKECCRIKAKFNNDPSRNRGNPIGRRENDLIKAYGISLLEYEALVEKQKGKCAICEKLQVDHSHSSGGNRKLLCHKCNNGLGCFDDNIVIMQRAIQYLIEHKDVGPSLTEILLRRW